ncbi:MAG: peptidoglycan editing factor PgeF [Treponema sp.]|nr:peptidoglycan editing factor PgeF [Treponema sp.]
MNIKYFSIPEFEKNGRVKTLYTTACDTAWNYEDAHARENFLALGQQLGITLADMVKSKQTHTNIVKVVTLENRGDGILCPIDEANAYDGLITNEKNLLLCTVEADCVPVYFYDPLKEVIAMVHSGWKGTVKKISEVAIKRMSDSFGCRPENLIVAIGPHICKDCYEVGQDVFEEFAMSYDTQEMEKIFTRKNHEKFLLNLEQAVQFTLIKNGIPEKNIFSSGVCTLHSQIDEFNFCSYRRTKSRTQRMLTAIMMVK